MRVVDDHVEIRVVGNLTLEKKIQRIKSILGHARPNISTADLFEKLCDDFLANHDEAMARADRKDAAALAIRSTNQPVVPQSRNTRPIENSIVTDSLGSSGQIENLLGDSSTSFSDNTAGANFGKQARNTSAPRENSASKTYRKHISAQRQRYIWSRDQRCCRQCGSARFLEIDHIIPLALGGTDDVENLRLLCRPCNQRAAIEKLGSVKMQKYFEQNSVG
jgi:HNH endonuclease